MELKLVYHIGFHKTGTSWLQKSFFSKEPIFQLLNDYVHPWNDDLCKTIVNFPEQKFNLNKCIKLFEKRGDSNKINVLSAERLSGHPISGGYDYIRTANRLYKINPNAKIIVTTRELKSFIISTYKQVVKEGFCGSFEDYISKDSHWKTPGTSIDYFLQEPIVKYYIGLFGEENVLVLNFEEFKNDKTSYLKKIERFLGINSFIEQNMLSNIVNKTYSNRLIRAIRFFNRFRKSEYHHYPLISIASKKIITTSKIFSFLFSNKDIINHDLV